MREHETRSNREFCLLVLSSYHILYIIILSNFFYSSQIWHHCGTRNTSKLEEVDERTLRFIFKDNSTFYHTLLKIKWIGLNSTLETRSIQDMLIVINRCFQERALLSINRLVDVRARGLINLAFCIFMIKNLEFLYFCYWIFVVSDLNNDL